MRPGPKPGRKLRAARWTASPREPGVPPKLHPAPGEMTAQARALVRQRLDEEIAAAQEYVNALRRLRRQA